MDFANTHLSSHLRRRFSYSPFCCARSSAARYNSGCWLRYSFARTLMSDGFTRLTLTPSLRSSSCTAFLAAILANTCTADALIGWNVSSCGRLELALNDPLSVVCG